MTYIEQRLASYEKVKLTTDLNQLTQKEKQMLPLLIEGARVMDDLFWLQAYGNKDSLLNATADEATKQFISINCIRSLITRNIKHNLKRQLCYSNRQQILQKTQG